MSNTNIQSPYNKSRTDKFIVVFDLPPLLKTVDKTHLDPNAVGVIRESVQMSLYGCNIPGIVVPATGARANGGNLYVSSHSRDAMEPTKIQFDLDNNFNNYYTIYSWLNLLNDEKFARYNAQQLTVSNLLDDYMTDISVFGLDEYNNKRIHWKFKKAFFTSLDPIDYNYRTADIIPCGATFVYSQVHVEMIRQ